jgi:chitin disaccharide deacetylase
VTRRLIVNADDFGLTPGVSAGILDAHRHGIVTSTTVLVTADIDRDQLARARDSGLGMGIHVNLTLGAPLTKARSLIDGNGRFIRDARRVAAQADPKDVEAEVAAQLERFEKLVGSAPTHLDSHHHVGMYTPVAEVVLSAAQRAGVAVRSQDAQVRARARALRLVTPDHFFGGSGPDAYWSLATTLRHLRALPSGVSEFMTHPGRYDDGLGYSRYGRQRETELVGLGTAAARSAAAALGITLCHFGDL